MNKLRPLSARSIVKGLTKTYGYEVSHKTGSHIIMTKAGAKLNISIPDEKEVSFGLIKNITNKLNISVPDLNEACR